MPPPLSRCSRWAYSSLKIIHPCQPSPIPLSCRPAHRPFRDLLGVHSRCGLHTRAVTVFRDRYPGASDISSPPCLPRLLPAGAVAGWALHPLEMRRLVTAHVDSGHPRDKDFATNLDPTTEHQYMHGYAFNSRLSSFKKRQSVPSAMIFCGLDLMKPASRRRRAYHRIVSSASYSLQP